MDAFFGTRRRRRPRPAAAHPARRRRDPAARARPGRDRVRRRGADHRRHRRALHHLRRRRHRGRHPPGHLRDLRRPRRGPVGAAHLPRPGRLVPALPGLPGLRHGHPAPVPDLRRRRPGPHPPLADREDPGRASRTACGSAWPSRARSAPAAAPAGDLYVEIHERPHDVYSRKGDDLHCRVTVPMTAAALGTRLTIKTLDSEETVEVKPGHPAGVDAAHPRQGRAAPARPGPRRPLRPPRRADADQARPPTRSGCCASSPRPAARRSPS